jgi:hypothetical protein
MAHAYNPSYSGGRVQEDHSLKTAQANSSRDTIVKKTITKMADGVAQGVGLVFKPKSHKKKKKKRTK